MKALIASLLAALLAGCATAPPLAPNQYVFIFESEPSGAVVYTGNGQAVGTTPHRGVYTIRPEVMAMDKVTDRFVVVWASGAKLDTFMTWHPKQNKQWRGFFSRPPSAPGLSTDLEHARAQQALKVQQAQADAQDSRDAIAAILGGFAAGQQRSRSNDLLLLGPTRCKSRVFGDTIKTDCD